MNLILFCIVGVVSLGIVFLHHKNMKKTKDTNQKMHDKQYITEKERKEKVQKGRLEKRKTDSIAALQSLVYKDYEISSIIIELLHDSNDHIEINDTLDDFEINTIENRLGFTLPKSYKIFLKYFGDGGEWVYANAIDSIQDFSFLKDYRKKLGNTIQLVGERDVKVDALLCLMTEDSNGGAWVWLTDEVKEANEWSLAYYSMTHEKLFYKVENFAAWLKILVVCKNEVISELDKDFILELG